MFPLNGNDHSIPFPHQTFFCTNSIYGISNPNHPPNLSLLDFPSPFKDADIFLHHQSLPSAVQSMEAYGKERSMSSTVEHNSQNRRRRRDRHTKINTAQGLRGRRIRLSLGVSERLFGLQDILGFDKASETVKWLLNQAKDEIEQLASEKNHLKYSSCSFSSSTAECELGICSENGEQKQKESLSVKSKSQWNTYNPLPRNSREKARERARDRTKEKMMKNSKRPADESKQCCQSQTIEAPLA